MNERISVCEAKKTIQNAKRNKASGFDGIAADVLKHDSAISFLHDITLASAMCKLVSSVLNARLSTWVEENKILVEEQNGFRKGRSTVDQISPLSNIINARKRTVCQLIARL